MSDRVLSLKEVATQLSQTEIVYDNYHLLISMCWTKDIAGLHPAEFESIQGKKQLYMLATKSPYVFLVQ